MRRSIMLEPQEGMTYGQILAVARKVEALGLDGLYRSDHYASTSGRAGTHATDAWATLAGLARETAGITIGTLVTPVTFRRAGNLAKVVATVAEMAGARDGAPRVHLGMGTGWYEPEHRAHGFPFEDVATRFRRLEEHLRVVRGLWDPDAQPFDLDGEFVTVDGARSAPTPTPRPRIICGGTGKRTTPRLAATYADELNTVFQDPDGCRAMRRALDEACERRDRDPASIPLTLMTAAIVGATEADYRARAARIHAARDADADLDAWLERMAGTAVLGGPERVADHLGRLADAGVTGIMLQLQDPGDLEMLDVIADHVAAPG